jgi:hypothetical protein
MATFGKEEASGHAALPVPNAEVAESKDDDYEFKRFLSFVSFGTSPSINRIRSFNEVF